MITDLPTEDEFRHAGLDLLNIAWDSALTLLRNMDDVEESGFASLDEISGDYWKAAARTLSTALGLTQQGAEFILKGLICRVTPFLLIATPVREWPSRAASDSVSFADFKTLDALELPKLHDAILSPPLPADFVATYQALRRQRNALSHTIDRRLSVSAHEVVIAILETSHHLVEPRRWLFLRGAHLEDSPLSVAFGSDFVEGSVIREALITLALLKPSEALKYFGFATAQRTYICPDCSRTYREFNDDYAGSAQLKPNEPASLEVWCFICNRTNVVRRESCSAEACKGDVIYEEENWCLTCGELQ
jgi:hypothetical protein